MKIEVKHLPDDFFGVGEVKGYRFTRIYTIPSAYIYAVNGLSTTHYEVLRRPNLSPVCIDFKSRLYSETEYKEVYPSSKRFGFDAWTFTDRELAINKAKEL